MKFILKFKLSYYIFKFASSKKNVPHPRKIYIMDKGYIMDAFFINQMFLEMKWHELFETLF